MTLWKWRMAVGADGVHLGQDDLPVAEAKKLMHPMGMRNFLVGASTHRLEQAMEAESQGADYIGIGPVFATPTKPTYNPVGLELVRSRHKPRESAARRDRRHRSVECRAGAGGGRPARGHRARSLRGGRYRAPRVKKKQRRYGKTQCRMNKKVTIHVPATSANLGQGLTSWAWRCVFTTR